MDFSARRAGTLARLSAYTLLVTFLITLVGGLLPLPLGDSQRLFSLLTELIANSTVPVVALFLLFYGLAGEGLPAHWEWRLLCAVRPLLQLAALLYLLTALALVGVFLQVESTATAHHDAELRSGLAELKRLRQALQASSDATALQQLLASQPGLLQAVDASQLGGRVQPSAAPAPSVAERRRQAALLLDRAEASLRTQVTRRRADASGNLTRQVLRLGLSALVYALFHLVSSLLWPRSLLHTRESILEARAARLAMEEEQHAEQL